MRKRRLVPALGAALAKRNLDIDSGLTLLGLWILLVDRLLEDACGGVADWLPYKLGANEGGWGYAAVELYGT